MVVNRYRNVKCTETLIRIAERYVSNCVVDDNYFYRNQKDIIDCLLALAHVLSTLIDTANSPTSKKIIAVINFFKPDLKKKRIYQYLTDVICHKSKSARCNFDEVQFDLLKPEDA